MEWWLNTTGNILQIVASVLLLVAALKYGRDIMRKHHIVSGALAFVLALSVLVSIAALAGRLGWLPASGMETVSNCHFSKEAVVLDNRRFNHCVFERVTFKYGGGPVVLAPDNKYVGPSDFQITDAGANNIIRMMTGLGIIGSNPEASIKLAPAN
jgi:hypothetical protein